MRKRCLMVTLAVLLFCSLGAWNLSALAKQASGEPIVLTVPVIFENSIPKDFELVAEVAGSLIEDKLGVQTQFFPLLRPSYDSRRSAELVMLDKMGIHFDLVHESVCTGELMPLGNLLETDGQGILALLAEHYPGFSADDQVLWIPSVSDYVTCRGLAMRTDLVEKYNVDLSQIDSLEDLTPIFSRISTGEPGMRMISGYFANYAPFEQSEQSLVSFEGTIFSLSSDGSERVLNYYATDTYRVFCQTIHTWYDEGYIDPYITLQGVRASQLVEAGVLFAYTCTYKPGIVAETSNQCKMPMTVIQLSEPAITAHSRSVNWWGISADCSHPEEAMRLLELFYTDPELANLFIYGLEGVHYQVLPDGSITYPEGVSEETVGYINDAAWVFPNQYLSHPSMGMDLTIWQELKDFNLSATPVKTLDFAFNSTSVQSANEALNTIAAKYSYGLATGQLDPDIYLDQMLCEMESVGVQDVCTELQRQYDLWRGAD